jgi:hypothetical protein
MSAALSSANVMVLCGVLRHDSASPGRGAPAGRWGDVSRSDKYPT